MTLLSLPIFTFATIKVKIIKRKRVSHDFQVRGRDILIPLSIMINFDPLLEYASHKILVDQRDPLVQSRSRL